MKQSLSKADSWKMFDQISSTYDKINRIMTFGLDKLWRKKVADFLPKHHPISILDCATGTADQILALFQYAPNVTEVVGVDLAKEMLSIAEEKIKKTPYAKHVLLQEASILNLPFPNESFDCATISFGIRNVSDISQALQEIKRVLKPEGRLVILETSIPRCAICRILHKFYLQCILPKIGGWISKQKSAYDYLHKTAEAFPSGPAFCQILENQGFRKPQVHPLLFGAVSIYYGDK